MRKLFIFLMLIVPLLTMAKPKNAHNFTVTDIDGKKVKLSSFKGKKMLIVNVASKCGLTPQYKDLQALHAQYGADKLVIIAFPSNDFRQQEPGSNSEIKSFCSANYGVEFLIMDKVHVTGKEKAPLYKWLTTKKENGKQDAEVTWNFQKFLIGPNGEWQGVVAPKENPNCKTIIDWIEAN